MHAQNRLLHLSLALVVLWGAVTPAVAQRVTEFPIPTASSFPHGITTGPDGALWFTELQHGTGRITTAGVIAQSRSRGVPVSRRGRTARCGSLNLQPPTVAATRSGVWG